MLWFSKCAHTLGSIVSGLQPKQKVEFERKKKKEAQIRSILVYSVSSSRSPVSISGPCVVSVLKHNPLNMTEPQRYQTLKCRLRRQWDPCDKSSMDSGTSANLSSLQHSCRAKRLNEKCQRRRGALRSQLYQGSLVWLRFIPSQAGDRPAKV